MTVLLLCQLNVFLKKRNVCSENSCMPITRKHVTKIPHKSTYIIILSNYNYTTMYVVFMAFK